MRESHANMGYTPHTMNISDFEEIKCTTRIIDIMGILLIGK
jgi:hypothetical protein